MPALTSLPSRAQTCASRSSCPTSCTGSASSTSTASSACPTSSITPSRARASRSACATRSPRTSCVPLPLPRPRRAPLRALASSVSLNRQLTFSISRRAQIPPDSRVEIDAKVRQVLLVLPHPALVADAPLSPRSQIAHGYFSKTQVVNLANTSGRMWEDIAH